jgi:hypothetical protein
VSGGKDGVVGWVAWHGRAGDGWNCLRVGWVGLGWKIEERKIQEEENKIEMSNWGSPWTNTCHLPTSKAQCSSVSSCFVI